MSCEHLERDLDAYVDRELENESATTIRDHLSGCAACRRHIAEREALSRLVRAAPYYTAPDRLRARVLAQTARSRSTRRMLTWAAAAVLVVSAGGGITLLRSASTRNNVVADEVVDNHVRALMANHLFDVQSTDQHTVKPWFLGKLDFAPPVVDLASMGFPLVGGRLDYLRGRPVAALVYQRQKHTINVFISPDGPDVIAGASVGSIRGFHIHHWVRDGMSYWAVSDLNDADLTQFVNALRSS
jgi:anti-sigma factor (TIGR02949 family)